MTRKWNHWASCAGGARLLSDIRFFQVLDFKALDAQFIARGRLPVSDTPEMCMFWRPYYAQAIRAAAQSGAKATGLDLAFGVPAEARIQSDIRFYRRPFPAQAPAPRLSRFHRPSSGRLQREAGMKRKWKHWAICAAGARLLSDIRFFQPLNLKALDAQFVARGRLPVSDIVLMVADQKALDAFPEMCMFWRPYYTQAIRAAGQSGAKAIGLDLAFGVPTQARIQSDIRFYRRPFPAQATRAAAQPIPSAQLRPFCNARPA